MRTGALDEASSSRSRLSTVLSLTRAFVGQAGARHGGRARRLHAVWPVHDEPAAPQRRCTDPIRVLTIAGCAPATRGGAAAGITDAGSTAIGVAAGAAARTSRHTIPTSDATAYVRNGRSFSRPSAKLTTSTGSIIRSSTMPLNPTPLVQGLGAHQQGQPAIDEERGGTFGEAGRRAIHEQLGCGALMRRNEQVALFPADAMNRRLQATQPRKGNSRTPASRR